MSEYTWEHISSTLFCTKNNIKHKYIRGEVWDHNNISMRLSLCRQTRQNYCCYWHLRLLFLLLLGIHPINTQNRSTTSVTEETPLALCYWCNNRGINRNEKGVCSRSCTRLENNFMLEWLEFYGFVILLSIFTHAPTHMHAHYQTLLSAHSRTLLMHEYRPENGKSRTYL